MGDGDFSLVDSRLKVMIQAVVLVVTLTIPITLIMRLIGSDWAYICFCAAFGAVIGFCIYVFGRALEASLTLAAVTALIAGSAGVALICLPNIVLLLISSVIGAVSVILADWITRVTPNSIDTAVWLYTADLVFFTALAGVLTELGLGAILLYLADSSD